MPPRLRRAAPRLCALLLITGCGSDTKFGLVNKGPGVIIT